MKTIIVAYDKNYGIGADNDLLWMRDMPADLNHFRDITSGASIIMGRKTYESIGRPLPNRQNIVVTHRSQPIAGCQIAGSLEAAYHLAEKDKEVFVIGGGKIYNLAIDSVDRIIATEVDAVFNNATIFFPTIDLSKWRETDRIKNKADEKNRYDYDFVTYERI